MVLGGHRGVSRRTRSPRMRARSRCLLVKLQSGARSRRERRGVRHGLRAVSREALQARAPQGSLQRFPRRQADGRHRAAPAQPERRCLGALPRVSGRVVHGTVNVRREPLVQWGATNELHYLCPRHRRPTARARNDLGHGPPAHRHPESRSPLHRRQDTADVIPELTLGNLARLAPARTSLALQYLCHLLQV